ncbi:MAG: cytochrome c peroxidase [Verrucomicrobiales bacterium]|nr:cytochrome c peroxidase [Verrucomicrobiales bacterium]
MKTEKCKWSPVHIGIVPCTVRLCTLYSLTFAAILPIFATDIPALRNTLAEQNVTPLEEPRKYPKEMVDLGQALFFDPVLGGNRDVSCATCHHPSAATGDGRSRAVGTKAYVEGGKRMPEGLRLVPVKGRDPVLVGFDLNRAAHPFTPRNSPEIFNRGDSEWKNMFWDGRIHEYEPGKFAVNSMRLTKSEGLYQVRMPDNTENLAAAQAMMPVLSNDEMRGTKGQTDSVGAHNEVGQILGQNEHDIWEALMKRLLSIEGYRELFAKAYPDSDLESLNFAAAGNAIAAFEISSFTLRDSPWDRFLEGDDTALTADQLAGAELFYGRAKCSSCHSGRLMTDQKMHNIGVIPIGPGPDRNEEADYGVAHRSNADLDQKYAFRTPPLRNVELTFPYMHNGAYSTLEDTIRHHLNPVYALENYDVTQLEPEFRGAVHNDRHTIADVKKTMPMEMKIPTYLIDEEVDHLVAFLKALTSPAARNLDHTIPESVPSGLKMVLPFAD